MLIILKRDEWDGLTIVKNHLDKPKMFKSLEEAQDYCEEFEIEVYQLVDIAI
jgi:viroplasmin and RNaseH domain-containing protein